MTRTNVRWKAVPAAALACLLSVSAWCGETKKAAIPEFIEGYRAFAIKVESYQLQYIEKGDRVDMLVTFEALFEKNQKEKVTATILQNVPVIDVQPAKEGKEASVLLMMNQNEAQYTALALEQGTIVLITRGAGDKAMKPMEMSSFRKLFR